MIRSASTKDILSITVYLSQKLNISLKDASIKARKIVKNGLPSFLKESKDLDGICWVETRLVNEKKEKFIEIYVNNWRLAESFLQCLKWELNGEYYFLIPKRDSLNRTYNKNGIKFVKIENENHLYTAKFEKRCYQSYKSEDIDAK